MMLLAQKTADAGSWRLHIGQQWMEGIKQSTLEDDGYDTNNSGGWRGWHRQQKMVRLEQQRQSQSGEEGTEHSREWIGRSRGQRKMVGMVHSTAVDGEDDIADSRRW